MTTQWCLIREAPDGTIGASEALEGRQPDPAANQATEPVPRRGSAGRSVASQLRAIPKIQKGGMRPGIPRAPAGVRRLEGGLVGPTAENR